LVLAILNPFLAPTLPGQPASSEALRLTSFRNDPMPFWWSACFDVCDVGEFTDIETGKGADALAKRPQFSAALAEAGRSRRRSFAFNPSTSSFSHRERKLSGASMPSIGAG
jgi:hypothetical protein